MVTFRIACLLAFGLPMAAAAQASADSPPLAAPRWKDPSFTIWTGAPNSELTGSRGTFFHSDELRAGWVVRIGPTEATIGLRGNYYFGAGWNANIVVGANVFRGLAVASRLEWHPIEDIMFAAEWTETGVRIACWQSCDWD